MRETDLRLGLKVTVLPTFSLDPRSPREGVISGIQESFLGPEHRMAHVTLSLGRDGTWEAVLHPSHLRISPPG